MKIENKKFAIGASILGLGLAVAMSGSAKAAPDQNDANHKNHGAHTSASTTSHTASTTRSGRNGATRTTTRATTTVHANNNSNGSDRARTETRVTTTRSGRNDGNRTVVNNRVVNRTTVVVPSRRNGHAGGYNSNLGNHRVAEDFRGQGNGGWHRPSGIDDPFTGLSGVVIGRVGNDQVRVRCDDGSILIVEAPSARYFYVGNRIRLGGSGVRAGLVLGAILSRL